MSFTSSTENPVLLSYGNRGYGENAVGENLEPSHLYPPEGYGDLEGEVGQQGINYSQLSPQQLQMLRMRQMQMREPFSGYFEGQGPQY